MESVSKTLDMTKGNSMKLIITFALPILWGNVFQLLYNIADTMIAGYTLGDGALSALGAVSAIYGLLVYMAVGMSGGFSIMVAQAFGEKNEKKLKNAIALNIVLSLVVGIAFTIFSLIAIRPLLVFIKTPLSIFEDAYSYIVVILGGILITQIYNSEASILRALGDSKTPLYYLIMSTIVNIVLDIVFIVYLKAGVAGAAWATIIAQLLSAVVCFISIIRKYKTLLPRRCDFHFEKKFVLDTFMMGLSMGLMSSIVSIGSVVLQSAINSLGEVTISAHQIARKIDEILMLPLMTLSTASATFIGQNYGAGLFERVKEGIRSTILCGFIYSIIAIIITYTFGETLVVLISATSSSYVINTATTYLKINIPFFFALDILFVLRTALQGIGQKILPIISSVIELLSKFLAAFILTPTLGYLGVCVSEPISWCAMALFLMVAYFYISKKVLVKL